MVRVIIPIIWSIVTIVLMAFLFAVFKGDLSTYLENLRLSFLLFFQLAPPIESLTVLTFLSAFERFLGFLFSVLTGLALKRRLEIFIRITVIVNIIQ